MGTGGSKESQSSNVKNQYIDFAPGTPAYNVVPRVNEKVVQIPTMFRWPYGGRKVYIVGTFNQWKEKIPMTYNSEENSFVVILNVTPGKHLYRFIVDNEYKTDPNNPTCKDNQGYLHNMIQISESEATLSHHQEDYENDSEEYEDSDEENLIDDEKQESKHKHAIDIKKKPLDQNRMEESPKQPSPNVPKMLHSPMEAIRIPPTEQQFAVPQPLGLHVQPPYARRSPPNAQVPSPQVSPGTLNIPSQSRSTGSSPSASPVTQFYEHQQNFIQQQIMMHQQQYQQQQQQQALEALNRQKQKEEEQKSKPLSCDDKIKELQAEFLKTSSPSQTPNTPMSPQISTGEKPNQNEEDSPRNTTTEIYGYVEQVFPENKKSPPMLPPHLRYTPLNSSKMYPHDPALLPVPLHVTVNHTYFSERETMNVIGITQRYREKFSTAVLYKPKKPKTQQVANAQEAQQ